MRYPGPLGSCSPLCLFSVLCWVCGVLGHLAPGHPCACLVCCVVVRCAGPLGSCSPVCSLGALCCMCGVLGHLAPVHWCARSECCVARAVSWATWLLFTGVPAWYVAFCTVHPHVTPWVLGLGALRCMYAVSFSHFAPVHGSARSVCSVACVVSWATWLLFTGVPAWCVVLRVRCPGPLGSCSPVCPL